MFFWVNNILFALTPFLPITIDMIYIWTKNRNKWQQYRTYGNREKSRRKTRWKKKINSRLDKLYYENKHIKPINWAFLTNNNWSGKAFCCFLPSGFMFSFFILFMLNFLLGLEIFWHFFSFSTWHECIVRKWNFYDQKCGWGVENEFQLLFMD